MTQRRHHQEKERMKLFTQEREKVEERRMKLVSSFVPGLLRVKEEGKEPESVSSYQESEFPLKRWF